MLDKSVSIILPTFNEAGNIVKLISQVIANIPPGWEYQIVVVDDNSPDDTLGCVNRSFGGDARVVSILRTKDRGFAKSIRVGIENARGNWIIVMDSDLTHDPVEIPKLLHVGRIYDFVSGSRFCAGGQMVDTTHYFISMAYNWFLRILIRTQVQDNLGGYFATRREILLSLPLDDIFFGYGEYYFRLIHFIQKSGYTVIEIPALYLLRADGKSKSNWFSMVLKYSRAAWELKRSFRKKKLMS